MNRLSLFTLLLLGAWISTERACAQSSADADKLLPDNTEMVFHLNVKSLLNSGIFVKHFKEDFEKKMKENSQLQNVLTSLGFDPLKDITGATVTISKFVVRGPGQPPELEVFGVLKGAFNVEKMNAGLGTLIAAANQGDRVSTSTYGDYTIYEIKDSNSSRSLYATILNKETIIGSTQKAQLTDAIERSLGKKAGKLNERLVALLNKARNQETFWGAFIVPSSVKDLARMAPPDTSDAISKLDSETFTVNVRDNVKFELNMNMADAGAATKLKELIDQLRDTVLGPAALSNEQFGSELADLVGSVQVGANGKAVSLRVDVKADLVDKVVKMMKDRGR